MLWSTGVTHFAKRGVDEEMPLSAKCGYTRFCLTKKDKDSLILKRTDASRTMDMHCDSQSQVTNGVNIAIYLGTEAGTIYQTLGLKKQYNGYLLRNTLLAIEH